MSPAEILGHSLAEVAGRIGFDADTIAQLSALSRSVLEERVPKIHDFRVELASGTVFLQSVVVPEFDADGSAVSTLAITRDVTEQREMEESLKQNQDQLQHAQRIESIGRLAGGVAHGTGLGLPVVYGIVQSHEGRIEVDRELGTGSVFNVFFPAAPSAAPSAAREEDSGREPSGPGTKPADACVLLVEDDEAIRAMVEQALVRSGLRVVSAGTVEEAEALVRRETEFDLVLTDIVLPDGSGATLPDRLNIDVPYIFASGYLEDTADLERVRASGFSFLQKP